MDKLREKGLGTFRERYQRTLEETETPELLDRKLRAIEQYRREMEGQMQRKKVLTQKALRQKAEGKSDDEEDVDPLVAQRVEEGRGLHFYEISRATCAVARARAFDLYDSADAADAMQAYVEGIAAGSTSVGRRSPRGALVDRGSRSASVTARPA